MRYGMSAVAMVCAMGLVGCSGPGGTSAADAKASKESAATAKDASSTELQPVAVAASATPDQVVSVFLEAIRQGDSATTENLLTAKAKEELEKHDFAVVPQATPNMQFQILGTELIAASNGAHVTCRWTEKYDEGDESYDVVWVLRRESAGWRVAGLAMQLPPSQDTQFLNFEDVADMERKKNEAAAAMAAAETALAEVPATETAQQPILQPIGSSIER